MPFSFRFLLRRLYPRSTRVRKTNPRFTRYAALAGRGRGLEVLEDRLAPAALGTISTVAGGGLGDGVKATLAGLSFPSQVAVDSAGDLFIADAGNNRIREVYLADSSTSLPPTFTSFTPSPATYGSPYTYTIHASGTAPITYSALGLPGWATLDARTGVLSGTPTGVGRNDIIVKASNGVAPDASVHVVLNVQPAVLTVTGITANNKVFDGTTAATLNVAGAKLVGVVKGDTVTLNARHVVGVFASSNVGNGISVAISGLSLGGAHAGDYALTQPTITASITAKATKGLHLLRATSGPRANTLSTIRLTFDQAVVVSSIKPANLALFYPGGGLTITSVTPVTGSGNTAFDVSFTTQTEYGTYTLYLGSSIKDAAGDHLAPCHTQFILPPSPPPKSPGLKVVSATNVSGGNTLGTIRIILNQPAISLNGINPVNYFALVSAAGQIALLSATLPDRGSTEIDLTFATQTAPGKYTLYIGPVLMDAAGELLTPFQTQFVLPAK
jgi:hypothetical protein